MCRRSQWELALIGLMVFSVFGKVASGEVFNTARTLKPRALSVAVAPQVFIGDPLKSELQFFGGIGIVPRFDLQLRYDVPIAGSGLPQYLGLDAEVGLVRDRGMRPALSWTMGAHVKNWAQGGLDATLMASKVFGDVEPYVAFDGNLDLTDSGSDMSLWMVAGLDVHLGRVVEFLAEGGTMLKQPGSYVTVGFNFYLAPAGR